MKSTDNHFKSPQIHATKESSRIQPAVLARINKPVLAVFISTRSSPFVKLMGLHCPFKTRGLSIWSRSPRVALTPCWVSYMTQLPIWRHSRAKSRRSSAEKLGAYPDFSCLSEVSTALLPSVLTRALLQGRRQPPIGYWNLWEGEGWAHASSSSGDYLPSSHQ